jgi:hypothetical protein
VINGVYGEPATSNEGATGNVDAELQVDGLTEMIQAYKENTKYKYNGTDERVFPSLGIVVKPTRV